MAACARDRTFRRCASDIVMLSLFFVDFDQEKVGDDAQSVRPFVDVVVRLSRGRSSAGVRPKCVRPKVFVRPRNLKSVKRTNSGDQETFMGTCMRNANPLYPYV